MPTSPHTRKTLSHVSRAVIKRIWTRGTITFLSFVGLATAFWLAVSLNETYEIGVTVPLELRDVPKNVVITTELPKELHVTIRDKGVRLLPYLYGGTLQPVTISYRDHNTGSGRGRFTASELLGQLQGQISLPTQILHIKPDTLEFYYNFGASKRVPVHYDGDVRCAHGHFVAQTKLLPEFVTIYAPQSVLDTLRSVNIRALNLDNVRDTVRQHQPVATLRGMKSVPATVEVTLITDRLTEKTLQIPIHALNFPATRVLRTFPSTVNVTFKVGVNRYDHITADKFVIALGYEHLLNLRTSKVPLSIRSIPEGASDVRITPAIVDFVIETVPEEEDSVKP